MVGDLHPGEWLMREASSRGGWPAPRRVAPTSRSVEITRAADLEAPCRFCGPSGGSRHRWSEWRPASLSSRAAGRLCSAFDLVGSLFRVDIRYVALFSTGSVAISIHGETTS
jgi:hypothetical protein